MPLLVWGQYPQTAPLLPPSPNSPAFPPGCLFPPSANNAFVHPPGQHQLGCSTHIGSSDISSSVGLSSPLPVARFFPNSRPCSGYFVRATDARIAAPTVPPPFFWYVNTSCLAFSADSSPPAAIGLLSPGQIHGPHIDFFGSSSPFRIRSGFCVFRNFPAAVGFRMALSFFLRRWF